MRDTFELVRDYINDRKWLLTILPLFCILLFVTTLSFPHKATLKTEDYTYIGNVLNDAPDGQGTLTYKNGDTYKGHFKQGKFDKKGTFYSKNGKWHYTGSFSGGLANGQGVMTTPDGKRHDVSYKNGILSK